jgi:hypothetical protein
MVAVVALRACVFVVTQGSVCQFDARALPICGTCRRKKAGVFFHAWFAKPFGIDDQLDVTCAGIACSGAATRMQVEASHHRCGFNNILVDKCATLTGLTHPGYTISIRSPSSRVRTTDAVDGLHMGCVTGSSYTIIAQARIGDVLEGNVAKTELHSFLSSMKFVLTDATGITKIAGTCIAVVDLVAVAVNGIVANTASGLTAVVITAGVGIIAFIALEGSFIVNDVSGFGITAVLGALIAVVESRKGRTRTLAVCTDVIKSAGVAVVASRP